MPTQDDEIDKKIGKKQKELELYRNELEILRTKIAIEDAKKQLKTKGTTPNKKTED